MMMAESGQDRLPHRAGADPNLPEKSAGVELQTWQVDRGYSPGSDADAPIGSFGIREILYVLFSHKWKIFFCFIASSVLALFYVSGQQDTYLSRASVLIRADRQTLQINAAMSEGGMVVAGRGGSPIQSEVLILKSVGLAEEVVGGIGPARILGITSLPAGIDPNEPFDISQFAGEKRWIARQIDRGMDALNFQRPVLSLREIAILSVQKNLNVSLSDASILGLTYASRDPELARDVLETILEVYQLKNIELNRIDLPQDLLDGEARRIRAELAVKTGELESLKKRESITDLEVESASLIEQADEIKTQISTVGGEISGHRGRVKYWNSLLDSQQDTSETQIVGWVDNPIAQGLELDLIRLRGEREQMLLRYVEGSETIRLKDAEIEVAERMKRSYIESNPSRAIEARNTTRQDLVVSIEQSQGELEGLVDQQRTLEAARQQLVERRSQIAAIAPAIQRLDAEIGALYVEFNTLSRSMQSVNISSMLDREMVSNVRIVDTPSLPTVSTKNLRKLLALLGFGIFAGLAGGVVIAFALEFLDQSVKTNDEAEKLLGLPVLASLPRNSLHLPEMQGDPN